HVTRAGPHVWVAGVVGAVQDGSIPSDVVAQFDITERPKINPRRIAYFGENLPASTLVEVKGLVDPRMKVEIECQAYVE
ncbi:MAG: RidA family protein, partial [Bradyrhizobium sp.]